MEKKTRVERLQEQFDSLEAQFKLLHEQFKLISALNMFERFHAFDAINDDSCPCCGGRITTVDNGFGSGVKLEAVHKEHG